MTRTIMALAMLSACSGGNDCPEPDGFYRVTLSSERGDCGGTGSDVIEYDQFARLAPGCEGRRDVADDGCSVDVDVTCRADDGYYEHLEGGWEQRGGSDYMVGEIVRTVRDPDGAPYCMSTYTVALEKI